MITAIFTRTSDLTPLRQPFDEVKLGLVRSFLREHFR